MSFVNFLVLQWSRLIVDCYKVVKTKFAEQGICMDFVSCTYHS